jgi:hypothetical protein
MKWDGKGLQIDEYLMEHQVERPANEQKVDEGWVTIGGHHVLIGGDDRSAEKMVVPKGTTRSKRKR